MAITGPFNKLSFNTTKLYKYQTWYRQDAPYRAPLTYTMVKRFSYAGSNAIGQSWDGFAGVSSFDVANSSPCRVEALNKAYDSFRGKVYEQEALIGLNVAERKSAMTMMAQRAGKVMKFARALARGRLGEACEALDLTVVLKRKNSVVVKKPRIVNDRLWRSAKAREARRDAHRRMVMERNDGSSREPSFYFAGNRTRRVLRRTPDTVELRFKRGAKSFGDNYLEFHFGWEPLVKDIWSAAHIALEDPFKSLGKRFRSAGSAEGVTTLNNPTGQYSVWRRLTWKESVHLRANVLVTNPNLHQLQQLGLLNPAVVLWELVPYSFVLDWFVNVGQTLNSYTDFAGLTLSYSSSTRLIRCKEERFYNYPLVPYPRGTVDHVTLVRTLGIPKPQLAFKEVKLPSVTRGLTAVSLLTQFLRRV